MERLVSLGEAAAALGVSITTLRRWEAQGKLAAEYTAGRYPCGSGFVRLVVHTTTGT